ncbi:LytR C-terminal domain-containing protein [Actinosynnema sp. NPDC020468]|uniref:LytR C-terminal domain-containing protein n=1 Tax=Actinosynnema sp. NPDC020468 TaxID=3154488 RepID=UPI00340B39DC
MTNPESTGSAHPARAAGIVLLGVAAVALVIGVTSLFLGGGDQQGAQPDPSGTSATAGTSTGEPGTSAGTPTSGPAQDTSTQGTPGQTTAAPPTTGAPPTAGTAGTTAPPATGQPPAGTKPQVRVYNNSTMAGLAARASEDVKRAGWDVAETGNYSQGQIPTTTVYFRPGTDEEAAAQQLGTTIKARVEPRFQGIQSAHAGIIVIVTNDYQGSSAGKVGS